MNLAVFRWIQRRGVSLFSFAILLIFPRLETPEVGQIVTWSIRDEALHNRSVARLFRDHHRRNRHIWTRFPGPSLQACEDAGETRRRVIDTASRWGCAGTPSAQVKLVHRYIADRRLRDMASKPVTIIIPCPGSTRWSMPKGARELLQIADCRYSRVPWSTIGDPSPAVIPNPIPQRSEDGLRAKSIAFPSPLLRKGSG